jgi:hypothetical protein
MFRVCLHVLSRIVFTEVVYFANKFNYLDCVDNYVMDSQKAGEENAQGYADITCYEFLRDT